MKSTPQIFLYIGCIAYFCNWKDKIKENTMKKLFHSSVVALLSILIYSCTSGGVHPNLGRAYALLNIAPDSAIHILSQTNRHHFSEKEKALYALYYSIAQDKSGLDVNRDTLLRTAYDYFMNKPNDSLFAKCNYYMGLYYQQVDSSKHAVDCFHRAIRSSALQHDLYTQYLASNRLSWEIYHNEPEEGLYYAREAYRLYEQLGASNIKNRVYLILRVEDCYRYMGKTDSASLYLKEALRLSEESNDKDLLGDTYTSVSKVYRSVSMPDSALYYAKLAWNISDKKEAASYSYLAYCFLDVDSLAQAEYLFKSLLHHPSSNYTKYNAYNGLLKICVRKRDFDHLESYSDSAQYVLKTIYQSSETDNQSYRKDNLEMSDRNNRLDTDLSITKFSFFVYILVSLFVVAGIGFCFHSYRVISKKKSLIEKQEADMLLSQERHLRELAEVNTQKQKEILEMQHKLDMEKQYMQLENTEKQLAILKQYVISKMQFAQDLDKLKKQKKINDLTSDDWLEIELFLNDTVAGFMTSFRESFPGLKENEFQLCMLLKLDFKNQDLARFYGIRQESIKHKLLMLKSKLGLEKSSFSAREYIKTWIKD